MVSWPSPETRSANGPLANLILPPVSCSAADRPESQPHAAEHVNYATAADSVAKRFVAGPNGETDRANKPDGPGHAVVNVGVGGVRSAIRISGGQARVAAEDDIAAVGVISGR